ERAEQKLFELATTGEAEGGFRPFVSALTHAINLARAAFKRDGKTGGLDTGFTDLDRKLGGLQKSDLVILAGRPSMGKTALATNIAFNAANRFRETDGKEGSAVAFFSLEMSNEQLATRLLGEHASVPSDKIRRGELKEEDFSKFL